MGDPAGIGPEIALKSLPAICKKSIPVIIGDSSVIDQLQKQLKLSSTIQLKPFHQAGPGEAELIDLGLLKDIAFGTLNARYGEASYRYILTALKLLFPGEVAGLVTCPINKAAIHKAGIAFMGHTELLAHYGGVNDYVMMMANPRLRVALATIHIPLALVPSAITEDSLFRCIFLTNRALRDLFGIDKPFIKVCGLNPHAGEKGVIGNEEEIIEKAIDRLTALDINVRGPYPADSLFHKIDCDAYIAMYHDQGLIPVKSIDFKRTVNITLGLPFVRTSPGHGTGFDIAGRGIADPSGLIEAYRMAEKLSE